VNKEMIIMPTIKGYSSTDPDKREEMKKIVMQAVNIVPIDSPEGQEMLKKNEVPKEKMPKIKKKGKNKLKKKGK
jgi:hypothetical protein